jgi:serine protease inhibitor
MKKYILIFFTVIMIAGCSTKAVFTPLYDSPGYLLDKDKVTQLSYDVASANNQLAIDMIDILKKTEENVFISPSSMMIALGMTLNGAANNTLAEMLDTLHMGAFAIEDFNDALRAIQLVLLNRQDSTLNMTNSIWIRDRFEERVLPSFIERNKQYFGAMVAVGDFDDPQLTKDINKWVSDATNKRIPSAIDEPIDPNTVMFLINTLYFKADWATEFDKADTFKRMFYGKANKQVDMMSAVLTLGYTNVEGKQVVLLPYKDPDLTMMVIMDDNNSSYSADQLIQLAKQAQNNPKIVSLNLPKVQIETKVDGKKLLQQLGMIDAFEPYIADFSNMAKDALLTGLHIADVTQKTFLAIGEKGTEAAAMTKVEMRDESAAMFDVEMIVDRPFTIVILDTRHSLISFMGYIQNPQP